MEMFGVLLDLNARHARLPILDRHPRQSGPEHALAAVVGRRVLVCENMALSGDLAPVLAKAHKFSTIWRSCLHNGPDTSGSGIHRQAENYRHFFWSDLNALYNGADYLASRRPIRIAQLRLDVI
jgi:hypothetical protein